MYQFVWIFLSDHMPSKFPLGAKELDCDKKAQANSAFFLNT
jgi:hypothetical protein